MEELIQYIVVNKDLGMSPGKIGAQIGHICTVCAYKYLKEDSDLTWGGNFILDKDKFLAWYQGEQKKIVLEGHQKDLEKLVEKGFFFIRDAGYTEIPANSLTVVSLGVMTREEAKQFTKRLQLLK
jgi:peptidyl-tRNA hydrolase